MKNTAKIRLLMLDLDGTIADTIYSIRDGVNMAMRKFGFPEKDYEQTRLNIGNGAKDLIRRSMPEDKAKDDVLFSEVFDYYDKSCYSVTYKDCKECYGGMVETLVELKRRGYTLAVLSNKQDNYVQVMVKELLPEGLISLVMGQTELPKKPDPTVPLMIAKELGFEPSEAAFIGDSDTDILTGKNAGMFTVGCAWGYRGRKVLEAAEADAVLDSPVELSDIFSDF